MVTPVAWLAFTVQSVITLHIPMGVNNMGGSVSNPVTTAYGPYPIKITAPQGLSAQNPVTFLTITNAQGFTRSPVT